MNSNQKSQVEKIIRISEVNVNLEHKISSLKKVISDNEIKIQKIQNFLFKQGITEEDIENYVLGIDDEPEDSKISSQEETEKNINKTNLFSSESRVEKTN